MRKKFNVIVTTILVALMLFPYGVNPVESFEAEIMPPPTVAVIVEEVVPVSKPPTIPKEDIDLIALVVMAEAENQCEEGKRLVIDTILNRVDSGRFADTIYNVVYQKSQFTSMWNGRIGRCFVKDDIRQLVLEELVSRYSYDVVFFNTGGYSKYGSPLYKVGDHYFSSL